MNSSRILSVSVATVAIAAGAIVAIGGVETAGATPNSATLHLTSKGTTSIFFVPCPTCVKQSTPAGAHIGGTQIDAGSLFNTRGHKVGHFALDSVGATPFTQQAEGELMLTATLVIGKDQIVAQGLEEPPLDHGTIAITGGTGHYRSARGQVTFTDKPNGATDLRISLAH